MSLRERGFDVTVYEKRALGWQGAQHGDSGNWTDGRKNLPGEHAYRVPFGCYQNIPDTSGGFLSARMPAAYSTTW